MKTVINPNDHSLVLAEWRGAQAMIWAYHISLKRMAIDLSRKGENEALYIIGAGCEYFSGPFRWNDADISIVTDPPNEWGTVRRHITDKQAGFKLTCSDVVIVRGTAGPPKDPFEGFFDGPVET